MTDHATSLLVPHSMRGMLDLFQQELRWRTPAHMITGGYYLLG
jgi:hypothetical protein